MENTKKITAKEALEMAQENGIIFDGALVSASEMDVSDTDLGTVEKRYSEDEVPAFFWESCEKRSNGAPRLVVLLKN